MVNATVSTILEATRPITRRRTGPDGEEYEDYDGEEEIAGIDDEEEPQNEEIEAPTYEDYKRLEKEHSLPFNVYFFHEQKVGDKGVDIVIYPNPFTFDEKLDDWKLLGLDWDYARPDGQPQQMCVVNGETQPLTVGKIEWLDKEVQPKVMDKINELMSQISG